MCLGTVECKENTSWLACGSCGTCLNCMLPRVQITTGLGFFLHLSHLSDGEDMTPALTSLAFSGGP